MYGVYFMKAGCAAPGRGSGTPIIVDPPETKCKRLGKIS